MERLVYRFDIILKSPLSVGTTYNDITDHDILTYSDGTPFVSATSICGSFFANRDYENAKAKKEALFGTNPENKKDFDESNLFVSDGIFIDFDLDNIKLRDFNRISDSAELDNKIELKEKSNGKFDTLYVKENSKLAFYIVYTNASDDKALEAKVKEEVLAIASKINAGLYRLGFKQNRGFGKLFINKLSYKRFDKSNYVDYLNFTGDLTKENEFKDFSVLEIKKLELDSVKSFTVKSKLKGSIMVREYQLLEEYDYESMTARLDDKDVAYIPGTTINGILQQRVRRIAGELNIGIDNDDLIKTVVDDAYIIDGYFKVFSRNRINRFTSNAIDKGLYTEKVWFSNDNSYCEFNIRFKDSIKEDSNIYRLYYLALQDLILGYAPIGGETSIGRGIFEGKVEDIIVKGVTL